MPTPRPIPAYAQVLLRGLNSVTQYVTKQGMKKLIPCFFILISGCSLNGGIALQDPRMTRAEVTAAVQNQNNAIVALSQRVQELLQRVDTLSPQKKTSGTDTTGK